MGTRFWWPFDHRSIFWDSGGPDVQAPEGCCLGGMALLFDQHSDDFLYLNIYQTNRHPHTCSETSYRITDVECIARAKNTSVKPDRNGLMIGSEKLCEEIFSTSLLEGFTCSDAAQSGCENRTVVWKLLEKRHAGSWLSRLPLTKNWKIAGKLQVRFHRNIAASSLAADCNVPQRPPAKLEVLHLYRWFTHTHPPAGGWEIKVPTMRWKWRGREMKMRWRWQWDESYLTRTQRGERKRRGKEKTPTHET